MSRIYDALKRSSDSRQAQIGATIDAIQAEVQVGVLPSQLSSSDISPDFATEAHFTPGRSRYKLIRAMLPLAQPVFPFNGGPSAAAEQYRMLRTSLVQHPAQPRVMAISSATPGDGKSTTTVNLAGTFALKSDSNVLIIDADLRRCGVAEALNLNTRDQRGLADVLRGDCGLDDAIVRLDQLPNLHVLLARRSTTNPAELLDSPAWKALIQNLRGQFSHILIDTTPMQAVADFKLVQQVVDGVVMVVRPDHTSRPALAKALEMNSNNNLLGLVINAYEDWFLFNTSQHYGYYTS